MICAVVRQRGNLHAVILYKRRIVYVRAVACGKTVIYLGVAQILSQPCDSRGNIAAADTVSLIRA